MYYSQAGQDKWVHDIIGNKGVFVEVGAYDGIQTSNTYALELLGWTGICIEANPDVFKQLQNNRRAACLNVAVTDYTGTIGFGHDKIGGERIIDCYRLDDIFHGLFFEADLDYMSLDIEGEELKALSGFNFDRWRVKLFTIEHNLYLDGPEKKDALYSLLTANGYKRIVEDVKCLDPNPLYFNQPFEDWYAADTFYKP